MAIYRLFKSIVIYRILRSVVIYSSFVWSSTDPLKVCSFMGQAPKLIFIFRLLKSIVIYRIQEQGMLDPTNNIIQALVSFVLMTSGYVYHANLECSKVLGLSCLLQM